MRTGLSTGLAPLYNSEVAPVSMRGAIGVLNQLAVTVGISISQILGLTEILGDEYYWPLLLGIPFVPFLQISTNVHWIPGSSVLKLKQNFFGKILWNWYLVFLPPAYVVWGGNFFSFSVHMGGEGWSGAKSSGRSSSQVQMRGAWSGRPGPVSGPVLKSCGYPSFRIVANTRKVLSGAGTPPIWAIFSSFFAILSGFLPHLRFVASVWTILDP